MIINETPMIMKDFSRILFENKDINDNMYSNTSELNDLLNCLTPEW